MDVKKGARNREDLNLGSETWCTLGSIYTTAARRDVPLGCVISKLSTFPVLRMIRRGFLPRCTVKLSKHIYDFYIYI